MKNRHLTEARKVKNDDYFININKDLIIKLKYPNTEIKEIYDLDYFTSAKNDRCKSNRNFLYSTCSNSSLTSSASSSSPRSSVRSENGSLGFDDDEAFTFQGDFKFRCFFLSFIFCKCFFLFYFKILYRLF